MSIWDDLLQTFSWITYWQGVGCKLSRAVYLAPSPPPEQNFKENRWSAIFITSSTTGIFTCKGYKLYFSQSEMLTSNFHLGFVLTRGGVQAVQGGLSCSQPRISERMDNPQILLHHLLHEYLVERNINFISVILRCLHQMFSWVYMYWQGVGGKLSRAVYLAPPPPPPPRISKRIANQQFLLHHLFQKYLVERDINFISVNLRCSDQMFSWVTYWQRVWGQAVQGRLSCPLPRISERMDNQQILLHHLLQQYLVERDINFILSIWDAYFQHAKVHGQGG